MLLAVLADIGQVEALGVLEVDLDRAELPRPAERVLDAEVDLGTVECAVAGRDDVRTLRLLQRRRERLLSLIPLFVRADPLLRTQTQRDLDLREAERAVDRIREVEKPENLLFDALEGREDVRVVLRERPDAR